MLVVGLTGGISSGKSTVAAFFSELGIGIIDADVIAKEIVKPDQPAYKKIVDHYGADILTEEKVLNRKKLRSIVFANPSEKVWLEELLHPIIFKKIQSEIKKLLSPYCIVVIPLLVETNFYKGIDRILVIDTPEEIQIARTIQRDKTSKDEVIAIMQSQSSRKQKLAIANDIIDNTSSLEELENQVLKLHQKYLALSK